VRHVEGDIIGWRAFRYQSVYGAGAELRSPIQTHHQFTLIGQNTAHEFPTDPAYFEISRAGFYVFRCKPACVRYFTTGLGRPYGGSHILYGTVLCYGNVAHHVRKGLFDMAPEGFRCQKLQILGLYSKNGPHDRATRADALGWPEILPLDDGPNKFPLRLKDLP
jgi:hypothetical protein